MKRALSILLTALLLLAAVPTLAQGDALQAGLYVSEDSSEGVLYLNEEGVGVFVYLMDGQLYANGVAWGEASLEIERTKTPFAWKNGVLLFTYHDAVRNLEYQGPSDEFALGDREDTAFAGEYAAEDGQRLSLFADGQGVFTDAAGEKPVFWGSFKPYFENASDQTDGTCFILYDSFMSNLTFEGDTALVGTEFEGTVPFRRAEDVVEDPAGMVLVSSAFDLAVTFPTDRWIVEDTEGGLLVAQQRNMIQFTFLSLPLDSAPNAPTLDAYGDSIWTDCLLNVGAAYDAAGATRADFAMGDIRGRRLATAWTRDEMALRGDSVLWYDRGRLYVALCVSNEDTRPEALNLLDEVVPTLRPAAQGALDRENQLPVDRETLEHVRQVAPVTLASEEVYYGYRMTSEGQTVDIVPFLKEMGMADAFDADSADFSRMGSCEAGNLYIGQVLHKTAITVAEQGTKAGAATVIEMLCGSAFTPDPKEVTLDRPFVYMLIDCRQNVPFFIGTMMDMES